VVHRITRREWAYVKATEGVGSKSIGYQVGAAPLPTVVAGPAG
jgi:hypothetical protein